MTDNYVGVILAGGQSRRMGQNKALMPFGDNTLFDYVLNRFSRQIDDIIVSTPSNHPIFHHCGHPLVKDISPLQQLGPLSGLYAAFDYCQKNTAPCTGIMTIAVDTPFFPDNYVAHMRKNITSQAPKALIAATHDRQHPTFAFWPLNLAPALYQHLEMGKRSILSFADSVAAKSVVFPYSSKKDPFFNINNNQEWKLACDHLAMLRDKHGKE